jgi:hypothetical protein
MSFSNQFALSLELTELIPLSLGVAGKTYNTVMSLARDLRVSIQVSACILCAFV